MSSIDPTGRLLDYLRTQTQEWQRQRAPGATASPQSGPGHRPVGNRANQEILALDRTDPRARRQAFRIFLRGVLVRELGAGVASDPGFPALVQRVQDTMEADADLAAAIEKAGELLLNRAAPR